MYAHAVFDFAFAEVVQVRLLMRILFQIFGNVAGNQDVSGVAANGFSQRTRSRAERNPNVQPVLSRGSKSLRKARDAWQSDLHACKSVRFKRENTPSALAPVA